MIAQPPQHRHREPRTVPIPTPSLPWALTGWGVAVLGAGFALALLVLSAVLAPIAAVIIP